MSRVIEIAQEVLRIPSYSGQEKTLRLAIADRFAQEGIATMQQNRNLLVHMPGRDSSRALIFNSHMDVVDIGDQRLWQHNPWGAEINDGTIYGRGASDMKGGLAASIETALRLSHEPTLPTDIWFTYVFKEEVDGSGTKSFANWFEKNGFAAQYQDLAAIFTEPTNLVMAEHGHRGNFFIEAQLHGDAGHTGRPKEIEHHAIKEMAEFLRDVDALNTQWDDLHHDSIFSAPTITPTSFVSRSKSWNKTADLAKVRLDLRTIPECHEQAYEAVLAIAAKYGITLTALESPSGYTAPDAAIIQALQVVVPDLTLEVSKASADLGFLTKINANGVIFGPGSMEQAHRIDESAPVEQIERAPDVFTSVYHQWATATV